MMFNQRSEHGPQRKYEVFPRLLSASHQLMFFQLP